MEAASLLGRANDKEREDDLEECVWTAKEGRLNKFNYPKLVGFSRDLVGKIFHLVGQHAEAVLQKWSLRW